MRICKGSQDEPPFFSFRLSCGIAIPWKSECQKMYPRTICQLIGFSGKIIWNTMGSCLSMVFEPNITASGKNDFTTSFVLTTNHIIGKSVESKNCSSFARYGSDHCLNNLQIPTHRNFLQRSTKHIRWRVISSWNMRQNNLLCSNTLISNIAK